MLGVGLYTYIYTFFRFFRVLFYLYNYKWWFKRYRQITKLGSYAVVLACTVELTAIHMKEEIEAKRASDTW